MITQEQYNNLMTGIEALNAKVDLYIRCQNSTEKEFRELERDVYNLKQHNLSPMSQMTQSIQAISDYRERYSDNTPVQQGIAWLR